MRFGKKLAGLLLATSLTCGMLMGCTGTADIDTTAVVATVNGEEVDLGFANFYARYEQSFMETYYMIYYGSDMWEYETDGVTYEDEYKDGVMTTIEELIITKQYAEELGLSLTDEELAEIQAVAEQFVADNTEDAIDTVSGTAENVAKLLELYLIEEKCWAEIVQDIDTEVTAEESDQKAATYVQFSITTTDEDGNTVDMTDDEIAEVVANMEALLVAAEDSGDLYTTAEELGYSPVAMNFNVTTSTYDTDMVAALDVLSEGEFTDIVEGDTYYTIAQLTSEYDEEATELEVESILSEREEALYTEVMTAVIEAAEVVVNEEVWATVDFINTGVTMYIESTETE